MGNLEHISEWVSYHAPSISISSIPGCFDRYGSSPNGRIVGLVSISDVDVQEGRKRLALGRPRNHYQGVTNTNLRRAPGLGFASSVECPMEKLNLRYHVADHESWRY